MFFNVTFAKDVKVICSLKISDGFVESISEYEIVISHDISRILDEDFMKPTCNFT